MSVTNCSKAYSKHFIYLTSRNNYLNDIQALLRRTSCCFSVPWLLLELEVTALQKAEILSPHETSSYKMNWTIHKYKLTRRVKLLTCYNLNSRYQTYSLYALFTRQLSLYFTFDMPTPSLI